MQNGVHFILIGAVLLILGITWKKPSYGGGVIHKYASIVLGFISVFYGLFSLF